MTQFWVMRVTGAALTIGGIGLAVFINATIADKTLLHVAVMGISAIISAIGIGIYEDAAADPQPASKPASETATGSGKQFAPTHTAQ